MRNVFLLFVVLSLFVANTRAQDQISGTPEEICENALPAPEPETRSFDSAEDVLEPGVDYYAIFCTEAGPIYVDLFENVTPVTVNNFVFLAKQGYYNNITFHRVIADFMAQGGDPTGTGTGGPGYQFDDEFVGYLQFDRPGLLAMANAGPATNGSQFFITTVVTSHLNNLHTIFGEVLYGQENVENLKLRDPQTDTEPGSTLDTVVIITDPSAVDVELDAGEPLDSDSFQASLDQFPELPGVELAERTGIYTPEDWVGTLNSDLTEDAQTFVDSHGLQFAVTAQHDNTSCDLETAPFGSIGYTIYDFGNLAEASAAMQDDFFADFITNGQDYEVDTDNSSLLVWDETVCDTDGLGAVMIDQVGPLVTAAFSTLPVDSPFPTDLWLDQVVKAGVYEILFGSPLRQALSLK